MARAKTLLLFEKAGIINRFSYFMPEEMLMAPLFLQNDNILIDNQKSFEIFVNENNFINNIEYNKNNFIEKIEIKKQ